MSCLINQTDLSCSPEVPSHSCRCVHGEHKCYRVLEGERIGSVQPEQEKALWRAQSPFQCLKELQESWRGTWDKGWSDRTQGMASHCQRAWMDGYWERIVLCEGGEALAQGA